MLKLEKEKSNDSCIYKIVNIKNNKIYIGSAVNFNKRVSNHLYNLRKNKHHSKKLQNSYNKHGEKNFKFIIIIKCPKEYLIKLEQKFLDSLKPQYNISPTAKNCLGVKHSLESNLKKSLNHFRKNKFGKDNPSSRILYQYDKDGNFIKKWYGAKEFVRFHKNKNYFDSNITLAARKGIISYGFIWSHDYKGMKINVGKKRRKLLSDCQIIQRDLNNNFIKEYLNIKEAANELQKCASSIRRCVQKKQKTAYGFFWEQKESN